MKVIAKTRFIHGAISAKKGDQIEASEIVIKELQAACLVTVVNGKQADEKQPVATKTVRKSATKTAGK